MTVQMYNSTNINIHVGDTLEWVKQYLTVCVYPTGLANATGDQKKYQLQPTQYELTGDMNSAYKKGSDEQLYVLLTVTYTNTYTLTAQIEVPVDPKV